MLSAKYKGRGAGVGWGKGASVSGHLARGAQGQTSRQASGHRHPFQPGQGGKHSVRVAVWLPVVFTPKATSREARSLRLLSQVLCASMRACVHLRSLFGAGFPKPARNTPASAGKPAGRAGRLGVCPAGIGRDQGSLAVSCPHCWPGLLHRSIGPMLGVTASGPGRR